MRRTTAALLLTLLVAASAPAREPATPLDDSLRQAKAEEAAATAQEARLVQVAAAASGEANRLRAQQAAAAQAIEAAEARITAAQAQYRLAAGNAAAYRARLNAEQQPVSSLLAGLATMARRPPLLALADQGSVDDLVQVSVLLDATMPAIRARTQTLSAQLARGQQLEASALAAQTALMRSRQRLGARQQYFARLQRQALQRSLATGGDALTVGDIAISASEQVEQLQAEGVRAASAAEVARLLSRQPPAPSRPLAADAVRATAPFPYALPVAAPVLSGVGSVDASGVRARGISFGTRRGVMVTAPAAGIVRYSGPFRDYDGLVILDHGHGWLSVLVNLASPLKVGDRVQLGQPLGRTLGPLQVQLSTNGQFYSPALIAGSSRGLSNKGKGG